MASDKASSPTASGKPTYAQIAKRNPTNKYGSSFKEKSNVPVALRQRVNAFEKHGVKPPTSKDKEETSEFSFPYWVLIAVAVIVIGGSLFPFLQSLTQSKVSVD